MSKMRLGIERTIRHRPYETSKVWFEMEVNTADSESFEELKNDVLYAIDKLEQEEIHNWRKKNGGTE